MKKSDVIKKQKGGIKWYKHVESVIGVDKIIDKTIKISTEFPDIWPNRWDNVHWSFGNAFRSYYDDKNYNVPRIRNNNQASFNLDEVLTNEQINYIKEQLNIKEPYVDCWARS